MNYSDFDVADFVADEEFTEAVLHPTAASDAFWHQWQEKHPEKQKILQEARLLVLLMESQDVTLNEGIKTSLWTSITKRIDHPREHPLKQNLRAPVKSPQRTKRSIRTWHKIAAVCVLTVGVYFVFNSFFSDNSSMITLKNENGKKSAFTLPDGTRVWLNAASQLSYSKSFQEQPSRQVWLTGEAFFDVTENKVKPFTVETDAIKINVLGTAFNVKSYAGENNIETTLVRGKIMITRTDDTQHVKPVLLTKDQQAIYSRNSQKLSLSKVETGAVTSWTSGKLVFMNRPFSEIKKVLERWYGMEIWVENPHNLRCRFSTTIDNEPITKILELFKATGNMAYEIKENNILIIKGSLCTE